MTISLETIIELAILKRVWKDIRSHDRQVHLTQAPLCRDSTGGLAFELSIKEALEYLRCRIVDGSYRTHPPLVIESVKSKFLRRKLSFLSLEDAIILGALVQSARRSIMEKMAEWVNFGRVDDNKTKSKKKKIVTLDYEGWWIKWLRYRKMLNLIQDDSNTRLVISDITNFFGSVDLFLLRSKISRVTSLDNRANDLLFYILDGLLPSEGYGPRSSVGLPVVADDTSRILAHFYLWDLDQELLREGKKQNYTRWVDDLVVSVPNIIEGGKLVTRIERALSGLGLVANSAKTTIITKEEFRRRHFEQDNDFLDEIHEKTEQRKKLTKNDREQFEANLRSFLKSEKEGYWNRVLRRYYTESRRLGSKTMLHNWDSYLKDFPSEAQHILDYVAFFPGSFEFCERLFLYLKSNGSLYEDIQILAYEALLLKPFPNDLILRNYIVHQSYLHLTGNGGFEYPSSYVRGLQALTLYKFGGSRIASLLAKLLEKSAANSLMFATYAFPVIAASDDHRAQAFDAVAHIEDSRILRIRSLIERLEDGEKLAIGVLLGLLEPKLTSLPKRCILNSRALPLLKIALRTKDLSSLRRVQDSIIRINRKIRESSEPKLVDRIALDHLR